MESALDYRIYKSYQVHKKIGKGAYGQVYRAIDKKTDKLVAIKKIFDVFQNLTDAKRTYRQLSYLIQLTHPCIIKLQRVISGQLAENRPYSPNKNVYAVFQLMEMDLAKALHLCKLEPLQRKFISLQLISALSYLHESGLVHRDIKPSNILLDSSCNTKICDFGLVRKISDYTQRDNNEQILTEYVASRWYRAPQILLNGSQISTTQIDMWSFGCVLSEMILGYPIFQGKNTLQQLEIIFSRIGMPIEEEIQNIRTQQGKFLLRNFNNIRKQPLKEILANALPEQIDLIQKILVFNPNKRLSSSQVLKHPYFDQLRQNISKFSQPPVKVHDNSYFILNQSSNSASVLQKYRQLIESLCISTYRTSNSSSSQAVKQQKKAFYDEYRKYLQQNPKRTINLQSQFTNIGINKTQKRQKSTRSSKYDVKEQYQKIETSSGRSAQLKYDKSLIRNKSNLQIAQKLQISSIKKTSETKGRSRSKNKLVNGDKRSNGKIYTPKQLNKSSNSIVKDKSRLVLNTKSKSKKSLHKSSSTILPSTPYKAVAPRNQKKHKIQMQTKVQTKLVKKKKKFQ